MSFVKFVVSGYLRSMNSRTLPTIFKDVTNRPFPDAGLDHNNVFGAEELEVLGAICGDDRLHYELVRELLDVEQRHRNMARRAGLFEAIDRAFDRSSYDDEHDALSRARRRRDAIEHAKESARHQDVFPAQPRIRWSSWLSR